MKPETSTTELIQMMAIFVPMTTSQGALPSSSQHLMRFATQTVGQCWEITCMDL